MTELYLITGFLGAGKTTFLKNFARLFSGRSLRLIVNEFGREGVDGALLRETDAALCEIAGGSLFCACRLDRFEAALRAAEEDGPDVVLVETSGLADPTNIRRVLEGFSGRIGYGGCVCLADAARLGKVFSAARACPRQIAASGLVLLNKTDLASPDQCGEAELLIKSANPAAHIRRTQYGRFRPEWLKLLKTEADGEADNVPDITLQKATAAVSPEMPLDAFRRCLALLTEGAWRIKGFVRLPEGVFYADCTGPETRVVPWDGAADNRLVLLAGQGMPLRKTMREALRWYGAYLSAPVGGGAQ